MRHIKLVHRTTMLAAALLIALGTSACSDEPTDYLAPITAEAQNVGAIRLAVGDQTMTVFKDGKVTLGPLSFPRGSALVTATLLDNQGNEMTNVDPAKLKVNMGESATSQLGSLSYTRIDDFSGTLTGTTVGTGEFSVSLFDAVSRRAVFGPYFVGIVVR